jgi:hypothetical protein
VNAISGLSVQFKKILQFTVKIKDATLAREIVYKNQLRSMASKQNGTLLCPVLWIRIHIFRILIVIRIQNFLLPFLDSDSD